MKRILLVLPLCLLSGVVTLAQQTASDAPATKEDIQKYLDVMHSREMMRKMLDAMSKPQHQLMHEEFLKHKDQLPPDFEERTSRMMDDMMKSFPWDEMLDAMIPVYQKHLTKGDVEALVAFYSTQTGQKVLQEMPAIVAEAMQAMLPIMQKQMDAMTERMQQQVAQMIKDSKRPGGKPQASPN
jgi:uncharacterized protein